MSIFPPSGYGADPADGVDPKWTPWFAWFPVRVDAYKDSEIKSGKFSYPVWMRWVESRLTPDANYDEEYNGPRNCMQYRLPQN